MDDTERILRLLKHMVAEVRYEITQNLSRRRIKPTGKDFMDRPNGEYVELYSLSGLEERIEELITGRE